MFSFLTLGGNCFAQDWSVQLNEPGFAHVGSVIETYDKGTVFPVNYNTARNYFEIIKLDAKGSLLWRKKYKFPKNNIFSFLRILKLEKGGYLLSGSSTFIDVDRVDPFLLKLNECFEPEWSLLYNDDAKDDNFIYTAIEMPNSNNLVLDVEGINPGYKTIMKVSPTGETLLSQKTFNDDLEFGRLHLLNNELYFFGGAFISLRKNPVLKQVKAIILKMDTINYNEYWAKISRLNDSNDFASYRATIPHSNTAFFATYNKRSSVNALDNRITTSFYLRKVDISGFTHWHKLLGDTTRNEATLAIAKINENRYVVHCAYYPVPDISNQFYGKMYVIDSSGNIITKQFVDVRAVTNSTTGFSAITDMIITSDNKILTIGNTSNFGDFNVYCKKYNQDLTLAQMENTNFTYDSLCSKPVKDSTYILPPPKVVYLVKDSFPLDSLTYTEGKVLSVSAIKSIPNINCIIYPNPTDNGVLVSIDNLEYFNSKLSYTVTNQLGQIISKNKIDTPDTFINLFGKAAGIYYLTISDKKGTTLSSYKIIKK